MYDEKSALRASDSLGFMLASERLHVPELELVLLLGIDIVIVVVVLS